MDHQQFHRSEVIDHVDPRTFQRYVLDRLIGSTSNTHFLTCHEQENGDRLALEVTTIKMPLWLRQLPLVELSPKIQIFMTPNYTVLLGDYHAMTLDKVMAERDVEAPWLSEHDARLIFGDLLQNYQELKQQGIHHGNICLNAIVRQNNRWKLDLIPAILDLFSSDRHYYPNRERTERAQLYALGVVLFKCLFGFTPYEDKYVATFNLNAYMELLSDKTPEGCSKIYYFLKARLRLSKQVVELLEVLLTYNRPFTVDDLFDHPWLAQLQSIPPFEQLNSNEEVKMISNIEHKHLSKCLAAIDKFKAKKVRLNQLAPISGPSPQLAEQLRGMFNQDFHLSKLQFSHRFALGDEPVKSKEALPNQNVRKEIRYFNNEVESLEDEFPCRELMKYVEIECNREPNDRVRRFRVLMYGYPYAVAFELMKVRDKQSKDIAQQIDLAVELLLIISNINYPSDLVPPPELLHGRTPILQDFEYYKSKYRELLNSLYKHFLNDAIHKYNSAKKDLQKNPSDEAAYHKKLSGLDSYRLCWKLLEASLIIRKGGQDLDLGRIETSERKEVELGLNSLLGKYFPNRLF